MERAAGLLQMQQVIQAPRQHPGFHHWIQFARSPKLLMVESPRLGDERLDDQGNSIAVAQPTMVAYGTPVVAQMVGTVVSGPGPPHEALPRIV